MADLTTAIIVFLTFLLAGAVKGVIGMGLPSVSLALLTVALDLPSAMALLLFPSFATNVWQGLAGGNTAAVLRRIWLFLFMATITVSIGAMALTRIDAPKLSALLGSLILIYAAINLAGFRFQIARHREPWAGPLLGSLNGILAGMTGSFVVPGVMYLQAIGLPRDKLIQAMGILFTVSTVALALALQQNQLLTRELALLSLAAILPALVGMWAGKLWRQALSEQQFKKIFFVSLLVLGISVIGHALL